MYLFSVSPGKSRLTISFLQAKGTAGYYVVKVLLS